MDHSHDHGRIRMLIRDGVEAGKNYNVIAKEIGRDFYLFRKSALPRAEVTQIEGGISVKFPDEDCPMGSDSMSQVVRFLATHKAEQKAEIERAERLRKLEEDREERAWKLFATSQGYVNPSGQLRDNYELHEKRNWVRVLRAVEEFGA